GGRVGPIVRDVESKHGLNSSRNRAGLGIADGLYDEIAGSANPADEGVRRRVVVPCTACDSGFVETGLKGAGCYWEIQRLRAASHVGAAEVVECDPRALIVL